MTVEATVPAAKRCVLQEAGDTPATGDVTSARSPQRRRVKLFLLFLAEFLESGIAAQRIPERIEPKKGRRNGRWAVN